MYKKNLSYFLNDFLIFICFHVTFSKICISSDWENTKQEFFYTPFRFASLYPFHLWLILFIYLTFFFRDQRRKYIIGERECCICLSDFPLYRYSPCHIRKTSLTHSTVCWNYRRLDTVRLRSLGPFYIVTCSIKCRQDFLNMQYRVDSISRYQIDIK